MGMSAPIQRSEQLGAPKRSEGLPERSVGAPCSGAFDRSAGMGVIRSNPEVKPKAVRRQFSAAYKRQILQETEHSDAGGIAALLRREGLYSSHLTTWRRQREAGEIAGLEPRKRGKKGMPRNPLADEVSRLGRENARLQKRLQQAETIIEVQKKLCEILGLPVAPTEKDS
jgi:transposase